MKVILGHFQSDVLLSVSINMTPSSGAFFKEYGSLCWWRNSWISWKHIKIYWPHVSQLSQFRTVESGFIWHTQGAVSYMVYSFKIIPHVLSFQKRRNFMARFHENIYATTNMWQNRKIHILSHLSSQITQMSTQRWLSYGAEGGGAHTAVRAGGLKPQTKVCVSFVIRVMPNITWKRENSAHLCVFIWYFCKQDKSLRAFNQAQK